MIGFNVARSWSVTKIPHCFAPGGTLRLRPDPCLRPPLGMMSLLAIAGTSSCCYPSRGSGQREDDRIGQS